MTFIIISSNEKILYTCSKDCKINKYETTSSKLLLSFGDHNQELSNIVLSSDEKSIFACGKDN